MPRVVRRAPLSQRILSSLNPFDYFLSLATDIDAYDWDALQHTLSDPLGIGLNILAAIARANADAFRGRYEDDVFQSSTPSNRNWAGGIGYLVCDPASAGGRAGGMQCAPMKGGNGGGSGYLGGGSLAGWVGLQLRVISWALVALSIGNALYLMTKKKRYRLFESNIEIAPATPHARRVRVDSSPSDSPMSIFSNLKGTLSDDPASRAHPDETRDVWELSVWDPTPLSLALLCYLSPVHVAVYFLSFPVTPTYTYTSHGVSSSSTIITVLATQILLSVMLRWLQNAFTQQAKDLRIIHKEVLHEYDTKFVQPRVNIRKRDVAVQCSESGDALKSKVEAFTPAFDRQGFKTAPNPNYAPFTWDSGPTGPPDRIPPDSVRRSPGFGLGGGSYRSSMTPDEHPVKTPLMKRMRQPQFTKVAGESTKNAYSTSTPGSTVVRRMTSSTSMGTDDNVEDIRRQTMPAREENRKPYVSHSSTTAGTSGKTTTTANMGTTRNPATVGMHGLVNWNREQNRGLSPSKARSPMKGARNVRASSYGESLGTPLGTPVRRSYY